MIKDITIGQFYPVKSPIHALDARFKVLATVAFVVILFVVNSLYAYIPVLLFLFSVIKMSKVPMKFLFRGVKPLLVLILFTVSIHLFFTEGKELFSFYFIRVTYEGLERAVFLGLRLILLIVGTSLMTFTTKPVALTDAIETLFTPLKKIGFPAHEIAMMMTIALRFIPTLLEETDKIMKAQMARGTDFENGSLINRVKNLVPILVPLFISSFRRADELAMAMEARCYNGGIGRTRYKKLQYTKRDLIAALCLLVLLLVVVGVNYAL